ncbi:MAG: glycosyltransferase [Chloroflexia bacterium]|nr:glycosyltransferase [Chloroflexia bacterium]
MTASRKSHSGTVPFIPLRASILGVTVDDVTEDEAVRVIDGLIRSGGVHQVVTINPEFVMEALRDAQVRKVLNSASLATPDGIGILWASRVLKGIRIRERVTGVALVERLAKQSVIRGWRIFFLGAAPGVAEKTAQTLRHRYAGLQVAGCYAGSPSIIEEPYVRTQIIDANPDILFVAYGHPAQDVWIARNQPFLNVPVAIGIGGTFDEIAGIVPLAPRWMHTLGLKWLFRLIIQPWRFNRILTAVVRFPLRVLRERIFGPARSITSLL